MSAIQILERELISTCCKSRIKIKKAESQDQVYTTCLNCKNICDTMDARKVCKSCWFEARNGHAKECLYNK